MKKGIASKIIVVLSLLVACGYIIGISAACLRMKKVEYMVVAEKEMAPDISQVAQLWEERMNKLGAEGWEFVTITQSGLEIYKR